MIIRFEISLPLQDLPISGTALTRFFLRDCMSHERWLDCHFRNDSDKALEILKEAFEFDSANFNLLIALADSALACRPPKFNVAAQAFKTGTESTYSPTAKLMFAHRYLHFVTECATENTSMNEALRLLRKTQQEVRQSHAENEDDNAYKGPDSAASFSRGNKTPTNSTIASTDKTSPNASSVNGTVSTQQHQQQQQQSPSSAAYQNYPAPGYSYNQYQQGYSGAQYPSWGYPAQQAGGYAGYNQQGWGGYPNYYGQR